MKASFITLLERSSISPKLCQELVRHSDIRLTMQVFVQAPTLRLTRACT